MGQCPPLFVIAPLLARSETMGGGKGPPTPKPVTIADVYNLPKAVNEVTLKRMEEQVKAVNEVTLKRMEDLLNAVNEVTLKRMEDEITRTEDEIKDINDFTLK